MPTWPPARRCAGTTWRSERFGDIEPIGQVDPTGTVDDADEAVDRAQLLRSPDTRVQQDRRTDDDGQALCTRYGDIEPVQVEQEADPARSVLHRRGRHRVDDDCRFLPLELVDRPDPSG